MSRERKVESKSIGTDSGAYKFSSSVLTALKLTVIACEVESYITPPPPFPVAELLLLVANVDQACPRLTEAHRARAGLEGKAHGNRGDDPHCLELATEEGRELGKDGGP